MYRGNVGGDEAAEVLDGCMAERSVAAGMVHADVLLGSIRDADVVAVGVGAVLVIVAVVAGVVMPDAESVTSHTHITS